MLETNPMKTSLLPICRHPSRALLTIVASVIAAAVASAEPFTLHTRSRVRNSAATNDFREVTAVAQWDPAHTAVVVCDMWDKHHCPDATDRVGEMVPRMNEVLKAARLRGALIIHCPSDTMDFYKDHPGRKLAQAAPKIATRVPLQGWCSLNGNKEPALPIDDSDGGCDGCPDCPSYKAWTREHPGLEIMDGDAITDSEEAFYLMRQRGITNVIVMGVHINMCVLGRPFSIRQMVTQGQNVVLVRDLTDSMYNHRKPPFVSHFRGTALVVEHIEQYWCPSVTSVDFIGGEPFRFKADQQKTVCLILGENEYRTWETLPEFARTELVPLGYRVEIVAATERVDDNDFKNWQAISGSDLLVVSVRRRGPPAAMLDAIRAHLTAHKPLVGIRTASHAFQPAGQTGPTTWPDFDQEVLGARYEGHYGAGQATVVQRATAAGDHPILTGVSREFRAATHLYKCRSLQRTVTPLLTGKTQDGRSEVEPVAWVNTADNRRVFYTSMGGPDEFQRPDFRRLLKNGILWALNDPIPPPDSPPAAANATNAAAREPVGPLSPEASAKSFHTFDDLLFEQVLSEPTVAQPVFLTFDERGRMWVVEYRQYPNPAGLKMVSRDNFWRAVYDKTPPPPPHHFRGADRVTIHESTHGDGRFDKHSTFVDGLNIATSVAPGRGGAFVLNPPYLLFYPDHNHDDVPDGDPQVLLSGFGLEDTHSVANSLRWGPDGWLYGCQGSTVTGNILVYGPDGKVLEEPAAGEIGRSGGGRRPMKPVYSQGQNIWRYHPEQRRYEVFSEGGGNAFGLEIDSAGRIFSGHNGGNTRGFHYQQGAYLQKGFEKHGPLSNPYAFGYFPAMPHNDADRFTHNFVLYDSGALGAQCQGRLLGVEPLQGRIVMSEVTREGSSFRTRDLGYPVTSDDRWFRPVDIKLGPDGAVYVCDWYDAQVNHYRNHEGQIDASNGRVYRLRSRSLALEPVPDLSKAGSRELVGFLSNTNREIRQTAQRLLADRKDAAAGPALRRLFETATDPQLALEALWAVHQAEGFDEGLVGAGLRHPNPLVRAWTVRMIGDGPGVAPATIRQLAYLAAAEPDIEVRAQLASTAKRLPPPGNLAIVKPLLMRDSDAVDARQPLLLWWAIEACCGADPEAVIGLFADKELWHAPLVRSEILARLMRRFASTGRREDLLVCARLFALASDSEAAAQLTRGFEEASRGRPLVGLPEELLLSMEKAGGESTLIGVRRGRPEAVAKALAVVADPKAPAPQRRQLIAAFGESRQDAAPPVLLSVAQQAQEGELRKAALGALGLYTDPGIAESVLKQFSSYPADVAEAALQLLTSRTAFTLALLRGVDDGRVAKERIGAEAIHRIKAAASSGEARAIAERLWPVTRRPSTAEMEGEITRLSQVVNAGPGSPYGGKKLFMERCGVCHRLFGQGAEVGPDLTVYKREDLGGLLLNIVNPSAEIREGYEAFNVETRDGRSLTGFIADKDPEVIVLRTPDGRSIPLPRSEIERLEPAGMSLMPEGLLSGIGDQRVRDLFAYLRSTQPLNEGK